MLELSHAIRHPSESKNNVPSISDTVKTLLFFSFFFCTYIEELFFCLFAVVPLKHGLNYEVLEKGHVRFWVQAVKLSSSVNYRFIVNDKEVAAGEVFYPRLIFFLALKSRRSRRTRVRPTLIFVSVFFSSSGL